MFLIHVSEYKNHTVAMLVRTGAEIIKSTCKTANRLAAILHSGGCPPDRVLLSVWVGCWCVRSQTTCLQTPPPLAAQITIGISINSASSCRLRYLCVFFLITSISINNCDRKKTRFELKRTQRKSCKKKVHLWNVLRQKMVEVFNILPQIKRELHLSLARVPTGFFQLN